MSELLLIKAASKGDLETVRKMLADGHDVNEQGEPLTEKQLKSAKWIINEAGTDAAADAIGREIDITPLMAAIENAHAAVVDALLEAGADVKVTDSLKRDALMVAMQWKQEATALKLLAAGSDPNAKDIGGEPVLSQAISSGLWKLSHALLDAGAKAQPRAKKDCLPLAAVIYREGPDASRMLMRLLDEGAQPKDAEVINNAIRNHEPAVLQRLLSDFPDFAKKADPDELLATAGQRRDVGIIKALLEAGIKPQNKSERPSGLSAVIIGPPRSSLDFKKEEFTNDDRVVPCLEALYAAGADINQGGGIPLHYAVDFILPDAVDWLLKHGADVNGDRRGKTPLDSANESMEIFERNIKQLKEIEPADEQGRTEIERDIADGKRQMAILKRVIEILKAAGGVSAGQVPANSTDDDDATEDNLPPNPVDGIPVAERRGLCDTGFSKAEQIMIKADIEAIAQLFEKDKGIAGVERDIYEQIDRVGKPLGHLMALVKLKGHPWVYLAGMRRLESSDKLKKWSKKLKAPIIRAGEESVSGVVYYELYDGGECVESFESDGQWFRGGIEIDPEVEDEADRMHGTTFTSQIHDVENTDWTAYESEWQFLDEFLKEQDAYLTFIWAGFESKDKPFRVVSYHEDEATPDTVERVDLVGYKPTETQKRRASQPEPDQDPLLVAIKAKDREAVASAIAAGADVNALPPQSDWSYLEITIKQGGGSDIVDGLVDQLLEAGANPTGNEARPLLVQLVPRLLAAADDMQTMIKLIAAGADVNASVNRPRKNIFMPNGQTPLIKAAQSGQVGFVKLLLRYGADPKLADSTGKTALDYAETWHREVRKDRLQDVPAFAEDGDEERAKEVIALLESAVDGTLDHATLPSDEQLIAAEEMRKKARL